jgi:uncharacterized protein (TIGR03437 family)
MHKFFGMLCCFYAFFIGATHAQQQLTVVSAASPMVGVTADSVASVFGSAISTETLSAMSTPWPTSLGDITSVTVTDSNKQQQGAGILFISPSQMNVYIPAGVAVGPATIAFPTTGLAPGVGTAALRIANVNIQKSAPGLFSAEGSGAGVAAALGLQVVIPTQIQAPIPVFACSAPGTCSAVPIALGVDTPIYLSFFGTGIRGARAVSMTIGTTAVEPMYAGPQTQYPGLDQVNIALPISLHGAGLVNVTLTADGVTSNAVQLLIQ